MNEIYDKLDEVKNSLNHLEIFDKLNESLEKIKLNDELINKIKKYNERKDENLRLDIYQYEEIKEYKNLENEVNLLILQINQKLKKIKDVGGCNHACH